MTYRARDRSRGRLLSKVSIAQRSLQQGELAAQC